MPKPPLGPTQTLVLCALDEHEAATTDQVAEYISHYQQEAGWTGSTPANERPAAYAALVRLARRGLAEHVDRSDGARCLAITPAGRDALAAVARGDDPEPPAPNAMDGFGPSYPGADRG